MTFIQSIRIKLYLFQAHEFEPGFMMSALAKDAFDLKTLVGCALLANYYYHPRETLENMALSIVLRFPEKLNLRGLNILPEEVALWHRVKCLSESLKQSAFDLIFDPSRDLEKAAEDFITLYLSESSPQ